MLVFPGPPLILPSHPSAFDGEYARPRRGEKGLPCGTNVFGIPASVGYTRPLGAVGKTLDCCPRTNVGIWLYFSDQYCIRSQRTPRFSVRLDRTLQLSCTKPAAYLWRP